MNAQTPHPHDAERMPPRTHPPAMSSSGRVTPTLVGLLCIGLLAASYERGRGHLHKLTDAVSTAPAPVTSGPNAPGGQDAIRLTRTLSAIGGRPEFLSATLLPGRGLEVLQITASIPGHGEVPLLVAPSLPEALQAWTGTGSDAHGALGTTAGGAFLFPWAGHLGGHSGARPDTLETSWQGQLLTVPALPGGTASIEGLALDRSVDSVRTSVLPDGQAVEATLHAGSFAGAWPSTLNLSYHVELTGQAIELTLTATNTGTQPAPVGIGWKPHFAIPSGDRAAALLTIPSSTLSATDSRTGLPTGHTSPAAGTPLDFQRTSGTALGNRALDATYTTLSAGLASAPTAILSDPGFNFSLRLQTLTPEITRLHVEAPAGKPWVVLSPATNDEDPTGPEWQSGQQSGLQTLLPGAHLVWKVRLEISTLLAPSDPAPSSPATARRPR